MLKDKNYFCTPMIPYPSGSLHIGHIRNYTINDIFNRFLKLKKYNIYKLIGLDCFGTPAENASIKKSILPYKWIIKNIFYIKKQFKNSGFFYIWNKNFLTFNKKFYKKTQWIFIKLLENKFIYLKNKLVNWDPVDKTVLSNEQVINGLGWRSGVKTIFLKKRTYFINFKNYKKELLYEIRNLNWPKRVKLMQFNWLGFYKIFYFKLYYNKFNYILILINKFIINNIYFIIFFKKNIIFYIFFKNNVFFKKNYKKKIINTSFFLFNFFNLKKIELWILDYKKDVKKIIKEKNINNFKFKKNEDFNYLEYIFFIKKKFKKFFTSKCYWKIKNWGISRQRYWGTPIPITICKKCGYISKNYKISPFILPLNLNSFFNFKKNLLYKYIICIKCNNISFKETDTLDTFFDSSWYFLNYFNFKKKYLLNKWLPINFYVGGIEHAILHLLYSRFIIKFLRDIKYLNFGEPVKTLFTQGMILNKTYYKKYKNGTIKWLSVKELKENNFIVGKLEKMSKSKKNGINPNDLIKNYGIDSLKVSIIYYSYLDKDFFWKKKYIINSYFFIKKFWKFFKKIKKIKKFHFKNNTINTNNKIFLIYFYKNLKKINNFYLYIKYNKIISLFILLLNKIKKNKINLLVLNEIFSSIIRIIYPIIPNITFKIWNYLYKKELGSIFYTFWPKIYYINLKKKYKIILFINNKKKDFFFIKNKICIKKIFNYMHFKMKNFKKHMVKKIILNKNILNLIY